MSLLLVVVMRILGDISLLEQVAETLDELLDEFYAVTGLDVLLHKADNFLREGDVVVADECLTALHAIDDALDEVIINEQLLGVFFDALKPQVFLLVLFGQEGLALNHDNL